jgi:hypothetical protein
MKSELIPAPTALKKCLSALEKREKVLAAQIQAVCHGYTTAAFVFGPGGLGKTHLICGILDGLKGKSWRHHTAYTTPRALMNSFIEYPESIHLFEDCEKMYKTDVGSSILRAACGSPRQRQRQVTYETADAEINIVFSGGVIIVSNEDIAKGKGPMQAVASRFKPIKWDMTVQERVARILQIAGLGWSKGNADVPPKECLKVAEFLAHQMLSGDTRSPVDIRTFCEHAMPAYLQHRQGATSVDWRDIVRSKLSGNVEVMEKRGDRNDRLRQLALAIHADAKLDRKAKMAKWTKETGMGQAIFYRHLRAAKSGIV